MAMKYYCDGCDKEVPYDLIHKISVSVKQNGSVSGTGGEFELCKGCASTLNRDSNPKNWTRCMPEAPRKAHGF